MILRSSKQTSVSVVLVFLLILSAVVVKCNKYSKNSRESTSCNGEFCEAKDENDEPCMDEDSKGDQGNLDDEPDDEDTNEEAEDEPEEFDYPKEGLFRWDPVKVSSV